MRSKICILLSLLVVAALVLGACAPAATEEPPSPPPEPTEEPAGPEPEPEITCTLMSIGFSKTNSVTYLPCGETETVTQYNVANGTQICYDDSFPPVFVNVTAAIIDTCSVP